MVETPADAPGERLLDAAEVATTPARSADALLRGMPGLHLSAHGGRGKGWQILYRGFDAEHGSDLAVSVEGVPLNEPSNVHAHGYLDLNLLPTALVHGVRLVPGADDPGVGAFGTAGAADFRLGLAEEGLALRVIGGTDASGGVRAAWRPEGAPPGSFWVGEVDAGRGVAPGRRWRHARLAVGVERRVGRATGEVAVLLAHADFDSPGALRSSDLEAGRVGLYDAYPGAGGGRSDRALALARLHRDAGPWAAGVDAWVGLRGLRLEQDFTGHLVDEARGDGTRQRHASTHGGVRGVAEGRWWVGRHRWRLGGGVQLDADDVSHRQDRVDREGEPWAPLLAGRLEQVGWSAWGQAELGWAGRIAVLPGVRAAGWRQAVAPTDAPDAELTAVTVGVVAPRVRVRARPHHRVELFGGYGVGYRPPRATGGVLGALVTSQVAQGGVTALPVDALRLAATGFHARLDDEQVFDHPSGTFTGAGATQRVGVELLAEARPLPWLRADLTATWADGRFVATGAPVPYAPRLMFAAGVGVHEAPLPLGSLTAGLRGFVVAPRPLPQGFQSRWAGSADLLLAWRVGRIGVGLEVDNVLLRRWRDGEFVYASWWDTDRPRSALPEVHVTAGEPPAARLWVEVRW